MLAELIEHHVEEEEKRSEGLFAQAKAAGVAVDDLGVRMQTRSFSGHKMKQGRPIN